MTHFDKRPRDVPELEAAGAVFRQAIMSGMRDLAEVMGLSKMEVLEPKVLSKLYSIAQEVDKGTIKVEDTLGSNARPKSMDMNALMREFPDMIRGPLIPIDQVDQIVESYRKLGRQVIAGIDSGAIAHLYFQPGQSGSVSFEL